MYFIINSCENKQDNQAVNRKEFVNLFGIIHT